jgi:exosortase/archaeosortase family protein
MIGLLFGELKRLSVRRRIALLAGALAIALVANFARAFTLVWVSATDAPAAAERWHDPLGYAIVGLVFVGSMALAALLGRGGKGESEKEKVEDEGTAQPPRADDRESPAPNRRSLPSPFLLPTFYFLLALLWLFIVEGGVELWYRSHERNLVARQPWTVRYPEGAPGFREVDISEDVKRTLRFDEGRQVSWKAAPIPNNGSPITNNRVAPATAFLFFFRWEPGTATILRARSHRPDICLPNVGWRQIEDHGVRDYSLGGDLQLPFRHFTFIREVAGQRPMLAESFFCMREDKVRPVSSGSAPFDLVQDARTSDWMPADRVRVVLEGLRNPGQQVMQFLVLSPQQMSGVEAEAQFRELLPQIVAVGGK